MPRSSQKVLNSFDLKTDALSDTSCNGKPCTANTSARCLIVLSDVGASLHVPMSYPLDLASTQRALRNQCGSFPSFLLRLPINVWMPLVGCGHVEHSLVRPSRICFYCESIPFQIAYHLASCFISVESM